jgi:hypothetical protein
LNQTTICPNFLCCVVLCYHSFIHK